MQNLAESLQSLLVAIAAELEALFTPYRWSRAASCVRVAAAVDERRREYFRGGLDFTGGGSVASRQTLTRTLAQLRRLKLVEVRTSRGRRAGVRLTHAGMAIARAAVAVPTARDSWPLLKTVAKLTHDTAALVNRGFVSEFSILGLSPADLQNSEPLVSLENDAAPLLQIGWLESGSDIDGRAGYAVTSAGRVALKSPRPKELTDLPPFNGELAERFCELHLSTLAARSSWEPSAASALTLPLSAGAWAFGRPNPHADATT